MRSRKTPPLLLILLVASIAGCDKGLSPGPVSAPPVAHPGFGGTVTYVSAWPPRDSVKNLWVAAVKNLPPDSSIGSFVTLYLTGGVKLSDTLSRFDDSGSVRRYELRDLPAATYTYIAVIRQYGATPYQLDVVGVYGLTKTHPLPLPVNVRGDAFADSVNIVVNFVDPPPQPFKP